MFRITLANRVISINSLYNSTELFLKDYITDSEESDFSVAIDYEDIINEKNKSIREAMIENNTIYPFSDEYLETLAVYRKIVRELSFYDIILFHGSVISVDNSAYLFTAKSGTGKSTHTRLWRELFKDRAVMINDDKPLIHVGERDVTVYGTPWDGKHHLSTNTSAPLKAICILERGQTNTIVKADIDEVYPLFLQQVYSPQDGEALKKTLGTLDRLMNKINIYRLKCNMDVEAAQVAYEAMKGD